nr:ferritin-like domain-containing protein [Acidimicrobiia bacterium]
DGGGDAGGGGGGDEGGDGGSNNQEDGVVVRPGDVDGGRDPNNPTGAEVSAALTEDLPMATFAAGLEVLAVNTYRDAMRVAASGGLGDVPAAVVEFMTTVMGHHQAALDQWNRALAISGEPEVTTPDPTLRPTVEAALQDVSDATGAARLALMLEDIAAATYLAAIPMLRAPESIGLAASIQPVVMQHAAVLHFVLGEYPVPDVFASTAQAAGPA